MIILDILREIHWLRIWPKQVFLESKQLEQPLSQECAYDALG